MLIKSKKLLFFLNLILFLNIILSRESLAIVTKSICNIQYKKFTEQTFLPKLNLGSELFNEDLIKTKENGFVKFSYLDDGTTIKIHKNSEVYVRGNIGQALIDKRLSISNGVFNFNVKKQENEEFTIITPTSVASVKGTQFILITDEEGSDEFYGFEGVVEVLNKESNTILRLTSNIKITSLPTGIITSEIMTQTDYNIVNKIYQIEEQLDSEEIIPDESDETDGSGSLDEEEINLVEQSINELRIRLQNNNGDEKELIIRYNE